MITGSAITGVDRSMALQVTTTSGIAEISSVRIRGPSTSAVHPGAGERPVQGGKDLALMIECFIDAGAMSRGWPSMNSQRSGWRACQASNSATVRGQSSRRAASAMALCP